AGAAPITWRRLRRLNPADWDRFCSGDSCSFFSAMVCPSLHAHVSLLHLIGDVLGSTPAERADRQRGILVRVTHKRSGIGDEKILAIPCLAMLIQHGAVWIVAHFRGADFMDDLAASRNTPLAVGARFVGDNAARRLDDVLERLLHVLGLQDLVLAPLEVKTQHGNAPLIDGVGIDLTIAVFVRDHFAASGETDVSAINFAKILLQLGAISAAEYALRTRQDAGARLIAADAELNVIATREWHFAGFLLLIIPPGHVHMHTADAVLVLWGKVLKDREESAHRRADRVHDVASDETRRVRQAVGKLAALRIKHDAGGLTA